MEQIDRISLISELFWMANMFILFYFWIVSSFIPKIYTILKLRIYYKLRWLVSNINKYKAFNINKVISYLLLKHYLKTLRFSNNALIINIKNKIL